MDSNNMEIIRLVVDIVARIVIPLLVPVVVYLVGQKPEKNYLTQGWKILKNSVENIH